MMNDDNVVSSKFNQLDQPPAGEAERTMTDAGPEEVISEESKPDKESSAGVSAAPTAPQAATMEFGQLNVGAGGGPESKIDLVMDIPLPITVELGRSTMLIKDILDLGPGSVIELDRIAGEPVDVLANGKLVAKGEVVVVDENFGVRIVDIVAPDERVVQK